MRLSFRLLPAVLLVAIPAFGQTDAKPEPPRPAAELTIPPEAVQQPNPVKPTPGGLAAAKKTYGYDCAMCHGADGGGKGDLATDMKLTLVDYRDPASLKNMTDGELFYIIKTGKGQMPGEGDRAKAPEIWGLVNYVRSFAKKTPAGKTAQ